MKESIGLVKIVNFKFLMDLHFLQYSEHDFENFYMSVCVTKTCDKCISRTNQQNSMKHYI